MKTAQPLASVLVATLFVAGCSATGNKGSADKDAAVGVENAVALVNGKPISKNAVNAMISEIGKQNPEQKVTEDKVIESLVSRELLKQEAERQNLHKSPMVLGRMENVDRDLLAQVNIDNYRKGINISDAECRKEYDAKIAGNEMVEFKARHILVESEGEAQSLLNTLNKGGNFAELAKKHSKDASAQQNGGELGWFNPGQMVPEFAQAVAGLKNGELAKQPVKTQFGWHVIQRQDARKQPPPPFDDIKEQIRTMLVGQRLQQHIEDLKKAAKIENLKK